MTSQLIIDSTTYRLSAFRLRQGWLGEWTEDTQARSGVISTPSSSAEEAIERAREEAALVHRRQLSAMRGCQVSVA